MTPWKKPNEKANQKTFLLLILWMLIFLFFVCVFFLLRARPVDPVDVLLELRARVRPRTSNVHASPLSEGTFLPPGFLFPSCW